MSQSKTTKEKLLESAIKIFSDKGFVKTKVSEIVKDANLSQGTFYNYFESKDKCFIDILKTLHFNSTEQMEKMLENEVDSDILFKLIDFFIRQILKHRPLVKIFLHDGLTNSKDFYELHYQFKENLITIFKTSIIKSNLKVNNLEIKLLMLSGTIREIMDTYIIKLNSTDEEIINITNLSVKEIFGELK
jgi:AcrR family transcriptional regulator